ncbi:K(+)-transporting ATPase subunit F [Anabaena cylindrica FACHB-243]|uniref:K+-transporting ATPase, F subunit n=1 Tax=Anabaena cylindrica (strain ATCC 27899 / PCC 7122) TaxID=272123 RepID=K9ZHQ0_ANACC|nr:MULTISPECIES: K(+)-transporting ATPase subunit F [Anabaena]AFZ58706.1 K+-transporting ATPase, F subunit [Anabaena cylindrica PCC 7122]MBD2420049.1 K(+)-transporting ATPase subunit F [Anabaena cylindrica FACHB-243]MBY5282980.1 K(+)-transporting ATPase subunit F [Anabaena sp. CCAP 1446/1C]MBY5306521.1 K(+)-transporting ATPase subunit F [Anabaena sp. CCAP 1446/1C]MCM2407055.1 K(+)-transporting ATPase subunit F [Anabaena sp. CCAP 1446/1C]
MNELSEIFATCQRHRIPVNLFLLLCLNVLLAPAVQAATPGAESRFSAYTITLLGLVTLSLCIYLFVVIFQPEKF